MRYTFNAALVWASLFLLAIPSFAQDIDAFYDRVDAFMAENVSDGMVDYAGVKANPADLDVLLEDIASMDRSALSPEDEQAFLVNTYNVLVIKNVVDHYPIGSPMDANGFFDGDKFAVAGASMTLDDVEKGDLYVKFPDSRFHFVLVCAAIGCPTLIQEAYRGSTLDAQLNERTRQTLNSPKHVRLDKDSDMAYVTELFSWYEDDFLRTSDSVREYINLYRRRPISKDTRIDFIKYDWTLNDGKKKS